jgi:hypothetical protein
MLPAAQLLLVLLVLLFSKCTCACTTLPAAQLLLVLFYAHSHTGASPLLPAALLRCCRCCSTPAHLCQPTAACCIAALLLMLLMLLFYTCTPVPAHCCTAAAAAADADAPHTGTHLCQPPNQAHEVHLVVDELHGLISILHAQLKVLLGLEGGQRCVCYTRGRVCHPGDMLFRKSAQRWYGRQKDAEIEGYVGYGCSWFAG